MKFYYGHSLSFSHYICHNVQEFGSQIFTLPRKNGISLLSDLHFCSLCCKC